MPVIGSSSAAKPCLGAGSSCRLPAAALPRLPEGDAADVFRAAEERFPAEDARGFPAVPERFPPAAVFGVETALGGVEAAADGVEAALAGGVEAVEGGVEAAAGGVEAAMAGGGEAAAAGAPMDFLARARGSAFDLFPVDLPFCTALALRGPPVVLGPCLSVVFSPSVPAACD